MQTSIVFVSLNNNDTLIIERERERANLVAVAAYSHEEVVWLDVSVDEALVVDVLYTTNHL